VVLHDIAQRAGLFVELSSTLNAKRLGHRDLDVLDRVPIPEGLREGVGEAEIEQVLDRFFSKVMIDAEDCRFVEMTVQQLVERLR
jgi:hypothetical protein